MCTCVHAERESNVTKSQTLAARKWGNAQVTAPRAALSKTLVTEAGQPPRFICILLTTCFSVYGAFKWMRMAVALGDELCDSRHLHALQLWPSDGTSRVLHLLTAHEELSGPWLLPLKSEAPPRDRKDWGAVGRALWVESQGSAPFHRWPGSRPPA